MRNRMKTILSFMLALICAAGLLAGCAGGSNSDAKTNKGSSSSTDKGGTNQNTSADSKKKPEDYKGTISVWLWDQNYVKSTVEAFNKVYPNIKVEFTNVAVGDYLQKMQITAASNGDLPDVLAAEIGWRGKAFSLDVWENLEQAPYNFDRKTVFDYLPPLTSNSKGQIIGIEQTVTPAALAFRRDVAKTYFGTDDPKQLESMFSSWDAVIEKGKELKQKSGGKVYMFASLGDVYQLLIGQNKTPLANGNVLNVTKRLGPVIEQLVKIRDAGIVDNLEIWSPQWNASYADGQHLFYAAANWSPQFVIKPNDKSGEGRWGLMMPPGGPYSWGGTVYGINKKSKSKELAWKYIEWLLLSKEGAEVSKKLNFFVPLKSAYDKPEFASTPDSFFKGQDTGNFWMKEVVPAIAVPSISEYDSAVNNSTTLILNYLNSDRKANAAGAMEKLLQEVKNNLPKLDVK
jgi:multiple sugar transport system substrate-binding protein